MERVEVEKLFSERLDAPVSVNWLHQTFPGQSQETWLLEALVGDDTRRFVLRVNPPGGGIVPLPLKREWEVFVRLARSPIPVGEPLWYGEDPAWFGGRPYFVRAMVEGSTEVPGLRDTGPAGEALRRQVALEHAEKLALLHTLDWRSYGFGEVLDEPADPADAIRREFETWRAIWEEVRPEPMPMVTTALYRLEEWLPASAPRISLLKGNNGLGEEIWRDGRIVAMSDWELASLGDPAQDWAFSQGLLDLWDRDATLAHYQRVAGYAIPQDNLDFWTVWTLFKAMCCTTAGLRGFLDGRDKRAVLPAIGFGVARVMEQLLGVLVTMERRDAAGLLAAMGARQLDEAAAGGPGRK